MDQVKTTGNLEVVRVVGEMTWKECWMWYGNRDSLGIEDSGIY